MNELWPSSRASSNTCARRRPDISTTSTSARRHAWQARLHGAPPLQRHGALAVVHKRAVAAEQRAVEVDVEAARAHPAGRLASGGGSGGGGAGRARERARARAV